MFLLANRRAMGSDESSQSCISRIAGRDIFILNQPQSLVNRREWARHNAASIFDGLLEFKGDQDFVLHDKNAMLRENGHNVLSCKQVLGV
jgi:hypothetical protein